MKVKIRLWVKIVLFIIIISSIIFTYGRFIEINNFRVNEYTIKADIPESFNGLKIVHFSDINYLHSNTLKDLEKIVDKINLIKPDIVVFTGDLLNKNINYSDDDIDNITNLLNNINAKIGKYAVFGEEDSLFDEISNILTNSNFSILDNSYEYIYNKSNEPIIIAGINNDYNNYNDFDFLNDKFSILLLHKPDNIDNINYNNYNLILSGHTIGGYINIPFINKLFLEDGSMNYYNNYYNLDKTKLYISNGIGTKNIKFRLFNKPSFNFYRINKKNSK